MQLGTRFIASAECAAPQGWKQAIVEASADDLVLTERFSGVIGSYLRTPELARHGTALPLPLQLLLRNKRTQSWTRKAMMVVASRKMDAVRTGERALWSAGQSADLVREVKSVAQIVTDLLAEATAVKVG